MLHFNKDVSADCQALVTILNHTGIQLTAALGRIATSVEKIAASVPKPASQVALVNAAATASGATFSPEVMDAVLQQLVRAFFVDIGFIPFAYLIQDFCVNHSRKRLAFSVKLSMLPRRSSPLTLPCQRPLEFTPNRPRPRRK
jgi:hypothetical protein